MKIGVLVTELQRLAKLYPGADIYFTDENKQGCFETYWQTCNIDEENNCIEMLFDTEEE